MPRLPRPALSVCSNFIPGLMARGARSGKLIAFVAIGGILQACSGDPMERCAEAGLSLDQTREMVEEAASRATSFEQLAEAQETIDQAEEEAIQACSDACSEAKLVVAQAEEVVRQAQEALDQTGEAQALAQAGDPFNKKYPAFFQAYKAAYESCPSLQRSFDFFSFQACGRVFELDDDQSYGWPGSLSLRTSGRAEFGDYQDLHTSTARIACGDGWGESCAEWTQEMFQHQRNRSCSDPNKGCAKEALRASIQLFQEYLLADHAWTQASEALKRTSEAEAVNQAENALRLAQEPLDAVHLHGCWR